MADLMNKVSVRSLVTMSETLGAFAAATAWAAEIHMAYAWASSVNGSAEHWRAFPLDRENRAVIGSEPDVLREHAHDGWWRASSKMEP
jgi:hypothetical protein